MPTLIVTPQPVQGYNLIQVNWADVPSALFARVQRVLADGTTVPVRVHTSTNASGDYIELSGGKAVLYDAEAPMDVAVTYTTDAVVPISLVNVGAGASQANATTTLTVTIPTHQEGDLMLLFVNIGLDSASVNQPTGWTTLYSYVGLTAGGGSANGLTKVFGKIATASESNPAVSFTGGGVTSNVTGQIAVFRGVGLNQLGFTSEVVANNSTTVDYPALNVNSSSDFLALSLAWFNSSVTSATDSSPHTLLGWTTINSLAQSWGYEILDGSAATVSVPTGHFTYTLSTAGTVGSSVGSQIALEAAYPTFNASSEAILASGNDLWLKSPLHPWANQRVVLNIPQEPSCIPASAIFFMNMDVEIRPNRTAAFVVNNRKNPISITRVRGGINSTLSLASRTFVDRDNVITLVEPGDPLFFQGPAQYGIPDQYMTVGDHSVSRLTPDHRQESRINTLPYIEVDRPAGLMDGVLGTRWIDLCDKYATFADATAAGLTWTGVLLGQGSLDQHIGDDFRLYSDIPLDFATYADIPTGSRTYEGLMEGA
jgi:hypothetical protein